LEQILEPTHHNKFSAPGRLNRVDRFGIGNEQFERQRLLRRHTRGLAKACSISDYTDDAKVEEDAQHAGFIG
jgi:hypothetical protein